jgi:hypothetical protein
MIFSCQRLAGGLLCCPSETSNEQNQAQEERMRNLRMLGVSVLVLGAFSPMVSEAQSARQTAVRRDAVRPIPNQQESRVNRDGYRRDDDRGRNDDRGRDDDWNRRDDRDDRRRDIEWWENRRVRDRDWVVIRNGNGRGPAFCRSGAGHPVHGRYWCVQKGYGMGRDTRWDRVRWDVIFRVPTPRVTRDLQRSYLSDVLGYAVYTRLDARRRHLGISRPLTGRWFIGDGRSVLVVSAGGIPLAELVDLNRDRRVDLVLVNFGR